MRPEEILTFIEHARNVSEGYCVSVTQNNTTSFYGFFEIFEDSLELMKNNKWRFVPINYSQEFFHEKRTKAQISTEFSIVIDGSSVTNLEVIRNFSRAS